MHWHILGAGAIGCLWAGLLSRAGLEVSLILRDSRTLEQWPDGGRLEIIEAGQTHRVHCPLETPATPTPIRHLLVATKAYDTLSAVEAILPRLQPGAEVVLLQNGMGQQQALLQRLEQVRLWAAITTAGAWRETRQRLHCVSHGETRIGPLSANTPPLPGGWARLELALSPCADIQPWLWRKLAINCAINPLTALFDCRNGALLSDPQRRQQLHRVCHEVEQVAAAAGVTLFDTPLAEQAEAVARATGDNLSSMLQDIRHGRRSEIEQITGFLCREADRFGLEVPLNRSLLQQIRALSPQEGA